MMAGRERKELIPLFAGNTTKSHLCIAETDEAGCRTLSVMGGKNREGTSKPDCGEKLFGIENRRGRGIMRVLRHQVRADSTPGKKKKKEEAHKPATSQSAPRETSEERNLGRNR